VKLRKVKKEHLRQLLNKFKLEKRMLSPVPIKVRKDP